MIVALEGPDGAGKTTLAERLRGELGATIHHDRYDPDQWGFTTARLVEALEVHRRGGLAVLDRCWIGEQIYGPIFRSPDAPLWGRAHDRVLLRHGCLYVFCLPVDRTRYLAEYEQLQRERPERYASMERVYDAYRRLIVGHERAHDEDWVRARHLAQLAPESAVGPAVNYAEAIALAGGWVCARGDALHYDRHVPTALDDTVEHLRRQWHLASAERPDLEGLPTTASPWRTAHPELGPTAAGRFSCETVLLVGEDNPGTAIRLGARIVTLTEPFFRPDGSSAYLARALTRAGLLESDVAYVNVVDLARDALTADGGLRPSALRRVLALHRAADSARRVVALGGVARATLASLGVEADEVVRHPQLARRFDHNGEYHLELAQAVLE